MKSTTLQGMITLGVWLLDSYITQQKKRQPNISATFKNLKLCKEKIGRAASKWFFFNSILANATKRSYYENMIDTIADINKGVHGLTPEEIYNTYLTMLVASIKEYIKFLKLIWDERGYTLMTDG